MYRLILIVAFLTIGTCGFPTSSVDQNHEIRRPEATGIQHNNALQDSVQESTQDDPLSLQKELNQPAPRLKRSFCLGIVTVCHENPGPNPDIADKLLNNQQKNLDTVVQGINTLAATLTGQRSSK